MKVKRFLLFALVVANFSGPAKADQRISWPDKTGPTFDGNADPLDAQGVPIEWDEGTGKNIAWKIPLQGFGHSTPVIGDGRLWFTAATADGKRQWVYGVSSSDGKILVQKTIFENDDPEPLGNPINNYAAPSCVLETDGVYVHFGTYGTARLDPKTGSVVWQRRDLNVRHFRGPGSSPLLYQNLLILTFDGIDRQFLVALDKGTGKTVWLTERSTDFGDLDADGRPKLDGDLRKAYATAAVKVVDGRPQVVSIGSRAVISYDALTGAEIWKLRHEEYNATAKPLFHQDLVILHTGSRTAHLIGLKLDRTTVGDVTETHVKWDRPRGNNGLPFPVLHQGRVYILTDTGVASCVDASSGKEIWVDRIGGTCIASPIILNGLIYFCNVEGITHVCRAGDKFEIVAKNELAEGMRASPAVAEGALYLRTHGHLYKIASP